MSCSYCFANLGRDAADRELHPENSLPKLLRRLDRAMQDEHDPIGFFLRERYPVCFSNTTDPFQRDEKTYRASETFLAWCQAHKVPVYLQTRGNVLYEEWERYAPLLDPGRVVAYLSICQMDDRTRRRHEPGALAIEKRWELARRLTDRGIPVVVACNPWVREWVPEAGPFLERCAAAGARGVWWECLHLSGAQADVLPLTYRGELLSQANTLPMYLIGVLKAWYAEAARLGLDFFPTPKWDGYFGHQARHPECADPAWLGGKTLDFNFRLLKAVSRLSADCGRTLVLFGWPQVEQALGLMKVPNPTLDAEPFWYPFNASVKADRRAWRSRLGKRAPLWEIVRHFWNRPWENQHLVWYHPLVQAVCRPHGPNSELYCTTEAGDLIAAFNPAIKRHGPFELDEATIDWSRAVWPNFEE